MIAARCATYFVRSASAASSAAPQASASAALGSGRTSTRAQLQRWLVDGTASESELQVACPPVVPTRQDVQTETSTVPSPFVSSQSIVSGSEAVLSDWIVWVLPAMSPQESFGSNGSALYQGPFR